MKHPGTPHGPGPRPHRRSLSCMGAVISTPAVLIDPESSSPGRRSNVQVKYQPPDSRCLGWHRVIAIRDMAPILAAAGDPADSGQRLSFRFAVSDEVSDLPVTPCSAIRNSSVAPYGRSNTQPATVKPSVPWQDLAVRSFHAFGLREQVFPASRLTLLLEPSKGPLGIDLAASIS